MTILFNRRSAAGIKVDIKGISLFFPRKFRDQHLILVARYITGISVAEFIYTLRELKLA